MLLELDSFRLQLLPLELNAFSELCDLLLLELQVVVVEPCCSPQSFALLLKLPQLVGLMLKVSPTDFSMSLGCTATDSDVGGAGGRCSTD